MTVEIPPRVRRQIKNFDKSVQGIINQAFKKLEVEPRPNTCIKIENEVDVWRIKVGEYRVAYRIYPNKISVVRVAHRSKIYARKEL